MESGFIAPLELLVEQFRKLSGIGRKTAVRMAFSVLNLSPESANEFAEAIVNAKNNIKYCSICHNFSEGDICKICANREARQSDVICVVEDARAVLSIEKIRGYRGLYHVLGGAISPSRGITPDSLNIADLAERVEKENISEVIIATNPTVEGETTAMYITRVLAGSGVKLTRIAYGIPVGGDLEYADEVTLYRAIENRRDV